MIFALNFTCPRDADLASMMVDSLIKQSILSQCLGSIRSITTGGREYPDYGNGAGWGPSMMKLSEVCRMIKDYEISDTDFILSVDSDVVFTSPEVFDFVDPAYGIIGIKHKPEFETALGIWSHMSGALIFLRGDIVRKMDDLTDGELAHIRYQHFKKFDITENEDVVLSYLASYVGANHLELPAHLSSGNFEGDIQGNNRKSFYHLNYCPTEFMGEPVDGKWRIPNVIHKLNIEL